VPGGYVRERVIDPITDVITQTVEDSQVGGHYEPAGEGA
jgi:hypothetical protein